MAAGSELARASTSRAGLWLEILAHRGAAIFDEAIEIEHVLLP